MVYWDEETKGYYLSFNHLKKVSCLVEGGEPLGLWHQAALRPLHEMGLV